MSSTTKLSDYKEIKKSQVIVKELTVILKIVKLTIKGLKMFDYYSPVKDLLHNLKDTKTVLEIHLNHNQHIVEGKSIETD